MMVRVLIAAIVARSSNAFLQSATRTARRSFAARALPPHLETVKADVAGGAALLLFVPAVLAFKNRNAGLSSGAKTSDSSAQWDDGEGDALEFEPVNSYQSNHAEEEAAEYGESTGLVDEVA